MLKNKNIMIGDGLVDIFRMILPYTKNILPTTVGLAGISAATSNSINKALNKNKKKKDTIIKLNDEQVKKINDNF